MLKIDAQAKKKLAEGKKAAKDANKKKNKIAQKKLQRISWSPAWPLICRQVGQKLYPSRP